MNSTFSSLPRVAQFEVAQLLSHPVLSGFLESAIRDLNGSVDLTIPMVADAAKCQQYVAEVQARRAQVQILSTLLGLAHTDFDTQSLSIAE